MGLQIALKDGADSEPVRIALEAPRESLEKAASQPFLLFKQPLF
jgi:hypothetical protein